MGGCRGAVLCSVQLGADVACGVGASGGYVSFGFGEAFMEPTTV